MKHLGVFVLMLLLAAVGGGVAAMLWYSNSFQQLDPRQAYCRGYVEGLTQKAATQPDEDFCLQSIIEGLDFNEIGLRGPLLP